VPANSGLRRAAKKSLGRFKDSAAYRYVQAGSKAWDIRTGSWNEPELDLIGYGVREGETALDIGANFGVWTYHLSRAVGSSGRVLAFEPIPYTCETLRAVARILQVSNAEIYGVGCGERTETVTFRAPLQESGMLAAGQVHFGDRQDDRPGKEGQVRWDATTEIVAEVVALDEFLPDPERVSLVKADIEGAEVFAFRGAERLLNEHLPTVVCEINPWFLEGFGQSVRDLTGLFFAKGYGLYSYLQGPSGPSERTAKAPSGPSERTAKAPSGPSEGTAKAPSGPSLRAVPSADDVVEDNYVFIHPDRRERFGALLGRGPD
jgi:FkbM family methyltransferase